MTAQTLSSISQYNSINSSSSRKSLHGMLPSPPPLADLDILTKTDAVSETRLFVAMMKKRNQLPRKTTVPGTAPGEHKSLSLKKLAPQISHSPTEVWDVSLQ
eukprot:scaffold29231_cov268-Amphora_coffeaeformis.AAC.3